jgi:hypothetical protein
VQPTCLCAQHVSLSRNFGLIACGPTTVYDNVYHFIERMVWGNSNLFEIIFKKLVNLLTLWCGIYLLESK